MASGEYGEETKRNNELVWASVFVNELNRLYGYDYVLVPERGENTPVDMYAVSKSGKVPQLQLQLTHAVELPFMAYEQGTSANYTKQPTIDAIERKCEKLKSQNIDLSQIVLIVQGYMNHKTANKVFLEDKTFKKFTEYDFAGIYYVAPSMMSGDTQEFLQNGYMIPIKDMFVKS